MRLGKPHGLRCRKTSQGLAVIAYEVELLLDEYDMRILTADLDKAVAHINGLLRAKAALEQTVAGQAKEIELLQQQITASAPAPEEDAATAAFHDAVAALPDNADYLPSSPAAGGAAPITPSSPPAPVIDATSGPNKLVLA